MKKKIKIAIVGTGYFSKFHFDAWKRLGCRCHWNMFVKY